MPSNLGTYFGILHGLHNIIVIITLNDYFIDNQSEKAPPINYHMIFQRPPFIGIFLGQALNMRLQVISTLVVFCKNM